MATTSQLAFEFGRPAPRRTAASREQALATRLTHALSAPVSLVLTDNRRRMVSTHRRPGAIEVRLHHMFLDAPEDVLAALTRYVTSGEASAQRAIGRFIEQNRHRITERTRRVLLRTRGHHHDLKEILAEVVRDHFPGPTPDVHITWGKMPPSSRRRRHSIRFGTYTHDHKLIRIHPALDQASVPRFFVAFVVFHELLHHVVPPRRTSTRVDYHPPEFRTRERAHPDYARAIAWESANIDALLRFRG